jgi:hypothetical protein
MAQTLAQQIHEAEALVARLHEKSREQETGQKIIVGAMLINAARSNAKIRKWLIEEAATSVKRPADVKRLTPLLDELRKIDEPAATNAQAQDAQAQPASSKVSPSSATPAATATLKAA